MKVAVIGGRDFNNFALMRRTLDTLTPTPTEIVSGGAKGADSWGAAYAKSRNLKLTVYLPEWEKYGKRAGFIRNHDIIEFSDRVVAFWDGVSRGTAHSIGLAEQMKVPLLIVRYEVAR